ncbi:hypothetical protein EH223_01685 [candidate division KSB1 bacterium]|nr:hypothetical protein [candidate division KSB1 bacterium]RQW06909.1 MAG: hypothetical protein EH223_01685 [candidate division KSB1 bacterium]
MAQKLICVIFVLVLVTFCCKEDDPVSPKIDKITMQTIAGTWYHLHRDEDSGMAIMLFLNNRNDSTASIGVMNGAAEVSLLEIDYDVKDGEYMFIAPDVDPSTQNCLQMMFADLMGGLVYADEIYLQDSKLHFVEGEDTYAFSKNMPKVTGGKITGSLSVTGDFGQGAAIVTAADLTTGKMGAAFMSQSGAYIIQGLENGDYAIIALYIPKQYALTWMDQATMSRLPNDIHPVPVRILNGNTVTGVNFNLTVEGSGLGKPSSRQNAELQRLAARCFEYLAKVKFFQQ